MIGSRCTSRCDVHKALRVFASLCALWLIAAPLAAQTRYVYFPSPRVDDGRFLTLAGSGLNTLGEDITLKIGAPRTTTTIEVGIFDGETGGRWDYGSLAMRYYLYADPKGDGTGTKLLAEWSGADMVDNGWWSTTLPNHDSAKAPTGDYFYKFVARNPDITIANTWSNFKVRTSGTIVALVNRPVAYTAPMFSLGDAQTICPQYPALEPTSYDGTWSFYLWQPAPTPSFIIHDGDMDYGSYNCEFNDDNDPDTRDSVLPTWAVGTMAVPEGIATSSLPCQDAAGVALGGTTTSNPADDARSAVVRRSPNVAYQLVTPDGTIYANNNPSGNLEWESFILSTAPFDRTKMDYHCDTLPRGVYEVHIVGVDMNNLNAFRFPLDAIGVDSVYEPVIPVVPDYTNGVISGSVYYESGNNSQQDAGEPGIPTVTVTLAADYNKDGVVDATFTTETDENGQYSFPSLSVGSYSVTVDLGTLADDVTPVIDPDGTATPGVASASLTLNTSTTTQNFGYKRVNTVGTRTRGYWVNHPDDWPVGTLKIGNVYYTQCQALSILRKATSGDKTYVMAAQLIATKLNLAAGTEPSCVSAAVVAADSWMALYPIGTRLRSWNGGESTKNTLDDYNNGRLCAGHMN